MLLWINFIMDIGAALALATEVPQPNKLQPVEYNHGKFITPAMYRSIYCQALYQFLVILLLLFTPGMFGDENKYNLIMTPIRDEDGYATIRTQHYTFLFQTYVLMNIFNKFNCRFIGGNPDIVPDTYNIFRFIFSNWWFLIVVLAELNF